MQIFSSIERYAKARKKEIEILKLREMWILRLSDNLQDILAFITGLPSGDDTEVSDSMQEIYAACGKINVDTQTV